MDYKNFTKEFTLDSYIMIDIENNWIMFLLYTTKEDHLNHGCEFMRIKESKSSDIILTILNSKLLEYKNLIHDKFIEITEIKLINNIILNEYKEIYK